MTSVVGDDVAAEVSTWRAAVPATRVPAPAPLALAVLLAVISWHTAANLGGIPGGLGYGVAVGVVTLTVGPWATERLRLARRWVLPTLLGICVVLLVLAFVAGVPEAYRDPMGAGSDRADALDVALSRLAAGSYPYTGTTYLGNPISPLPGALLLASPFWALTGDAGWQNLAWLVVLVAVVHGRGPLRARPTLLWVLVALGGLEVFREFLVGDDLVTGTVPAVALVALTLRAARRSSLPVLVACAVGLGVTTCTRPHLALVLVIVTAVVWRVAGPRRAALVGAVAGLTWVALIGPFLLHGTGRFSPLHVTAKVTGERGLSVGIVVLAVLSLAALGVGLAILRPTSVAGVGWFCAAVLAAPSLMSFALAATVGPYSHLDLTLGAAAVPFAVWATAASPPSGEPATPPS